MNSPSASVDARATAPDDIVEAAREREHKTRSELIREAIAAYAE